MKPGRELDALVAEKVMGYPGDGNVWYVTGDYANPDSIPEYSTDIAAAWEVVEKMKHSSWSFSIRSSDDCEAEFSLNDGKFLQNADTVGMGRGDTAPYAICLAALKAVGIA